MENFLCKDAIQEAYEENGTTITLSDIQEDTDVPEMVCKALNPDWDTFDEKKKSKKESKVKRLLNEQSVSKMTIARLDAKGVKDELINWFEVLIRYTNL